jgi:uncharacterized membrane protein YuzA (DUF378 family)
MARKMGWNKGSLEVLAVWLVAIGALNWGLVGLLNINLVNWLLGSWPTLERAAYILVGIAGVYKLYGVTMK